MSRAVVICLTLLRQPVCCALRLAAASAGSNIAARMAMMAMTTSNSIKVKPERRLETTRLVMCFQRGEISQHLNAESQFRQQEKLPGIHPVLPRDLNRMR